MSGIGRPRKNAERGRGAPRMRLAGGYRSGAVDYGVQGTGAVILHTP
ncbi:hypothetical protein ABIB15_001559 [Marisediminicola sp. UYEF4]